MIQPILEKNKSPIPAFLEKERQNTLVEKELKRIIGRLNFILNDPLIRPENLPMLNKELRKLAQEVWDEHALNSTRATHTIKPKKLTGLRKILRDQTRSVWEKHVANNTRATHINGKNKCVGCAKCKSDGKCKKMKAKKKKK